MTEDNDKPTYPMMTRIVCPACAGDGCVDCFFGGTVTYESEPVSINFEFHDVDPEALDILIGGELRRKSDLFNSTPTFSVDVVTPVKRTFWQWLLRKPKQYNRFFVPNARMVCGDPMCEDCHPPRLGESRG